MQPKGKFTALSAYIKKKKKKKHKRQKQKQTKQNPS